MPGANLAVTDGAAGCPAPPTDVAEPCITRWFALRIRSRHDFAVRDRLTAAGVTVFLPTTIEESRWADRVVQLTRPLFAGYVFIRIAYSALHIARRVPGVVQILGSTPILPIAIDDQIIADLRRVCAMPVPVVRGPYVAGERVTVQRGPFAGVTGVVKRVKNATTLSIPVEILGRSVSVQIDAADVRAAA